VRLARASLEKIGREMTELRASRADGKTLRGPTAARQRFFPYIRVAGGREALVKVTSG